MAGDREELDALRRMAELEYRAGAATRQAPGSEPVPSFKSQLPEAAFGIAKGMMGGPLGIASAFAQEGGKIGQRYLDRAAYSGGGAVTDALAPHVSPEIAGGAGYIANVGAQAIPMLAGGALTKVVGQPLAQEGARKVMQGAVKPGAADIESGAARRAIQTMLDEGINATPGGMQKVGGLTRGLDTEVNQAIANSPATVSVAKVGGSLRDPYNAARTQVNPNSDMGAVRAVWDEFRNSPLVRGSAEIPVQLAQALKRGTYRQLGEKAYGELASSATEAQKALARGLREQVAAKVPEVVEPLQREAALMNVLNVAERKALMNANKDLTGLAPLASNPLAGMGFLAQRSALLKSLLARALYSNSGAASALPGQLGGATAGLDMGREQ